MPHTRIGGVTLSYPDAEEFPVGDSQRGAPILSRARDADGILVEIRLADPRGLPRPELHIGQSRNHQVIPLTASDIADLGEATRERIVVGLPQPHLAKTAVKWLERGRLGKSYAREGRKSA